MKYPIFILLSLLLVLGACSHNEQAPRPIHEEENSVYYWKTVFHLNSEDVDFLDNHNIRRIYLRMFDVTHEPECRALDEIVQPNASVRIDDFEDYYNQNDYRYLDWQDSLKQREFVPVVYITLDALKAMKGHEGHLARNIVMRVKNMCSYNDIPNVAELQLDCDWTPGTETSFFSLCDSVKLSVSKLNLAWRLSSTIRLHQLARNAPPVDNGVLMVYNTGNFNDPDVANSIIDVKDVEPYIKNLSSYPLHLDIAYPTYSWQLLFRKRKFIGLLNGLNLTDTIQFAPKSNNVYIASRDIPYNKQIIRQGDMVRQETSSYNDIIAVKNIIEKQLSNKPHSNIIYHLDAKNLSNYSNYEIETILSASY